MADQSGVGHDPNRIREAWEIEEPAEVCPECLGAGFKGTYEDCSVCEGWKDLSILRYIRREKIRAALKDLPDF